MRRSIHEKPNSTAKSDLSQKFGEVGPIESKMRATIGKLTGTKYQDAFDWSVYDQISAKFDPAPRGGVVFNTTFKLQNWHSTCTQCHYAFELDTYGRGCFHDCIYCYAKDTLTTHGYWNRPQPFPVNLAEIRKVFYQVFETDKKNKWRSVMEKKVPLRIGSMSDSFMYMEAKYGVTKELLNILKFYDYPYIIFTRSDLVARDEYLASLDKELCSVQFSIIGNNQKFIRPIEPGAPSYQKRLRALEKLSSHGFRTAVRINPLFPKFPDGYFTDPEYIKEKFGDRKDVPSLPFYTDNFIGEIADANVTTVLAGFVRINGKAVNNISRVTGVDFRSFFREGLAPKNGNGDGYYTDPEIGYYYKAMAQEARKNHIRFSTCYIGNGEKDYYQYQNLWANKKDCCDVVGALSKFRSTSQSIPWETRVSHAPCKEAAIVTGKKSKEMTSNFRPPDLKPDLEGRI